MNSDLEVYSFKNDTISSFIDIIVDNGHIYQEYHTSKQFDNIDEMLELQHGLIVDYGYVLDRTKNNKWVKLVNQNSKISFKFWNDNFVEKSYVVYIGPVIPDQSFFN